MIRRLLLTVLAAAILCTTEASTPESASISRIGERYPIEFVVSRPAALLHWLDSLCGLSGVGLTAGKTVEAHRASYRAAWGQPEGLDVHMLEGFRRVRSAFAEQRREQPDALTFAFFEAGDLEDALRRAQTLLEPSEHTVFARSMRYFDGRYRRIWAGGTTVREFIASAEPDDTSRQLDRFLARIASFYGVEPGTEPLPRLVLAPVRQGHGTHAQAIGRFLLVEVRAGERLLDQVAPIVHENAHYLFMRMGRDRLRMLAEAAVDRGDHGTRAWELLHEALPTAVAQGVAESIFRPKSWSADARWYHRDGVDVYAKRIAPLVHEALREDRKLDRAMIVKLVDSYVPPASPEPATAPGDQG